jgi:hypothetical protein
MMSPKFFGLMLSARACRRLRSSALAIFFDTETASEKGESTMYRPGRVSSQESRGPLVEIGSFRICTRIGQRLLIT